MVGIKLQGGLANQMFMIAFLVSYAEKHGLKYHLPSYVVNPHIPGKTEPYHFEGLNYSSIAFNGKKSLPEKSFAYHEYGKYDEVMFEGYFQSHKYFDEKRMQELFAFPWQDITDVCAIHVRRDNYLKWSEYHPPVTKEYILLAMDFMNAFFGIKKFRFFSDDIGWCVDSFFNKTPYKLSYITRGNEISDLTHISHHRFLIGSNSAFSLWGHYLNRNENKFAIFPETWFGPKLPHDTKDVYPPKSIQL